MYQFLFRRNDPGCCGLSHTIDLWRINGAPGHCLVDGTRRIYREFYELKSCGSISRILSRTIIYLSAALLPGSICLPTPVYHRYISEQLNPGSMWHFSMQGLPASDVTITSCELLPHIFTLTIECKANDGCYFLWHYLLSLSRQPCLSQGALLFAVRTFL